MVIYEKSLGWTEWEFKKNAIHFAGEAFDKNKKTVETKGHITIAMTLGLLVEVALLTAWIARA
jgi:hypothetical protein